MHRLASTGLFVMLLCAAAAPFRAAEDSSFSTPDSFAPADGIDPRLTRARLFDHLGISRWHQAGFRGKGLKVAILDTGFQGYRTQLGRTLPATVAVHSFRIDGNLEARESQHGILCGEVIHAVAPDAELLLANWEPDQPASFLAAVRWAREQGARVISCSVIMPSWSDGEGRGAIHKALTELLAGDLLCFASAGNTAQRHWSGSFRPDKNGCHEWVPGAVENLVKPWGGERVSVEMCWHSASRYEVIVEDTTTGRTVARGVPAAEQDRCHAVARFHPEEGRVYTVRLRLISGQPGEFHLVVLGGGLHYASRCGSVAFPADGPEIMAVGAVDSTGRRCSYSSCGPNSGAPKPDFVAEVPFPTLGRARPFSGTSAAAPQAAALAALMWCRHPDWSAGQVRDGLRQAVHHLGLAEHSTDTGFGCLRLPER